jgi:sugar-specific transcriptional regulator TrmB
MKDPLNHAIRPLLRRIGLEDREIEVYLALLALKVAPASRIAKEAKQERSNTYLILKTLTEKGLISEVERGKVMHFVAEDPNRLLGYVQDKEKEFKSLHMLLEGALPVLRGVTKPLTGKPRVTLATGLEAMKQVYRDLLRQEFVAAFNLQNVYDTFGETIADALFGNSVQLHGREFVVDNPAGRRYLKGQACETLESRLLPKGVAFEGDILIFNDTIAMFAYDDEKTVVRIENKNLSALLKAWFEMIWSTT